MRILVTGATGFIGKYVVNSLLNVNDVNLVVSSSNEDELINFYAKKNVEIIPFDIYRSKNDDNLFEKFGRPDKLIHLAWKGLPNYGEPFHIIENLPSDFQFLENLVRNGLKDITVTGTCFEYGMQSGELTEDLPTFPANFYALAKDTLRKMLEFLQQECDYKLKWVRLFYMYGEGQNPKSLIAELATAMERNEAFFNMSGGEQVRDYMHVEDVAKNIVKIAMQNQIVGVINNSSGVPQKLSSFVIDYINKNNGIIKLNLGYYPYSPYEPMEFWGNNKKLLETIC